jgi:DNA repair exonuclease SbcCD ATPase subunit
VVATWKIDRRAQAAQGAKSPQDIRAIGRSESDLLTRVEEVASSLRESTMRDPRKRLGRSSDPTMPEEQAMSKAVDAMGRAVTALDALKTTTALPPEMQALNALLEAQSLVKKRQISRQQTAQGGPGNNNRNYDVSTLFDKELQRLQETNYEARPSGGRAGQPDADAARLKDLARRQDELLRREQQLQNLPEQERRRELEKLIREQAELRQQAEELTKSASKNSSSPNATSQLRDAARDMEGATNALRRQDAASSQSRGRQALEKLQRLANQGGEDRDGTSQPRRGAAADPQSQRLQDALAQARELQQKLDALTRELQQLQGRGQDGERRRLQQDADRQLQQTRDLIEQLRREDPSLASGGPGFTYEGQGMTFSAPGPEAFKQDLSRWQTLRDQATRALDRVTANVSEKLAQKNGTTGRAASGVDDTAPASYRAQVDAYFKAIAAKKAQ